MLEKRLALDAQDLFGSADLEAFFDGSALDGVLQGVIPGLSRLQACPRDQKGSKRYIKYFLQWHFTPLPKYTFFKFQDARTMVSLKASGHINQFPSSTEAINLARTPVQNPNA